MDSKKQNADTVKANTDRTILITAMFSLCWQPYKLFKRGWLTAKPEVISFWVDLLVYLFLRNVDGTKPAVNRTIMRTQKPTESAK